MPSVEERWMLIALPGHHDLDEYLFTDLYHALKWMSAPVFVKKHYHDIARVSVKETAPACYACGAEAREITILERFTAAQFLEKFCPGKAP